MKYLGPAISIIAITMSFQVFGWKMGTARTIAALTFSVVIGLLMQFLFRKDDEKHVADGSARDGRLFAAPVVAGGRRLWQTVTYIGSMVGILIFVNWASSKGASAGWDAMYQAKYWIAGAFGIVLL